MRRATPALGCTARGGSAPAQQARSSCIWMRPRTPRRRLPARRRQPPPPGMSTTPQAPARRPPVPRVGIRIAAKIACAALRASGPPAAQAGPASRLTTGSAPLVAAPVSPAAAQAHDIAGGESLPLPSWLLAWAASTVLVISFVGLAVLWPSPRLARARERRLLALPRWLDGVAGVLHASRLPSGLAGGPGAAFDLADARGGRIAARALRGRPYALTFLYTPCPDVCRQTSTTRSDPTRNSGRSATRTTRRLSWLDDRRRAPRPQPSGSSTPAAGCERRTPPGLR